ncbi:hypothetical protein AeMF1_018652 [Aphanomyces euteiches]|nr:hypothetical protein AeMF1_018652 [Aphanomyces euteiches]KAH9184070.1 hypothetical protein AeNC1_013951 [Aphanomyces euteiches]
MVGEVFLHDAFCIFPMLDHIFRTKPLECFENEEEKDQASRELGLWALIAVGIGGTVGSGIFATTGDIISGTAGPAAFVSWMIAGLSCILSGFAYMEMSSIVPSSGSTYSFAYHALGELPAMIAAWLLTLEYGMSSAGVARSWAQKVQEWADESGGNFAWLNDVHFNLLASAIMLLSVLVGLKGVHFGKLFINTVTVTKIGVVLFIILFGLWISTSSNFVPFVPPRNATTESFGFQGVILGASQAFFGFVGFDEVCCMATETRNPQTIMPRAVIGTILGTMFLSAFASLALSGMLPYDINAGGFVAPYSFGGDYLGYTAAKLIVHIGEVGTMPVVVFISFLMQPRLMHNLAMDGLAPEIFGRVDENGNLVWCTLLSGAFFILVTLLISFSSLWNMITFSILVSFIMTNASLLLVRTREASPVTAPRLTAAIVALSGIAMFTLQKGYIQASDDKSSTAILAMAIFSVALLFATTAMACSCPQNVGARDLFRAPLVPWVPTLAITVNWFLVAQFDNADITNGCLWIGVGVVSYFLYGFKNSAGRRNWNLSQADLETQMPRVMMRRSTWSRMLSQDDAGLAEMTTLIKRSSTIAPDTPHRLRQKLSTERAPLLE